MRHTVFLAADTLPRVLMFTQALANQATTVQQYRICLDEFIDCSRYSRLEVLLHVTAYVLRFIHQVRKNPLGDTSNLALTAVEIKCAENSWIHSIQSLAFSCEIQYLLKPTGTRLPLIAQFGLFIDANQELRCRGRINCSQLPLSGKQPMLLPPNHYFVTLLICHAHDNCKHSGVNDTLVQLREKYWILRGHQATRKVVRACAVCKRIEGLPYPSVSPPDLPRERVSEDPPFSHIGIDFAGPLHITGWLQGKKSYISVYLPVPRPGLCTLNWSETWGLKHFY